MKKMCNIEQFYFVNMEKVIAGIVRRMHICMSMIRLPMMLLFMNDVSRCIEMHKYVCTCMHFFMKIYENEYGSTGLFVVKYRVEVIENELAYKKR